MRFNMKTENYLITQSINNGPQIPDEILGNANSTSKPDI